MYQRDLITVHIAGKKNHKKWQCTVQFPWFACWPLVGVLYNCLPADGDSVSRVFSWPIFLSTRFVLCPTKAKENFKKTNTKKLIWKNITDPVHHAASVLTWHRFLRRSSVKCLNCKVTLLLIKLLFSRRCIYILDHHCYFLNYCVGRFGNPHPVCGSVPFFYPDP